MASVSLEVKQRHWIKKREAALLIECACGCGEQLKNVDRYGRKVKYINGHNGRLYKTNGNPKTEANKRWKNKNPEKYIIYKRNYYRKKKLALMARFHNKCDWCGLEYNGINASIFEFHHKDPSIKENSISTLLMNRTMDDIELEIEKCVMICAHCHIIHHNGSW